MLLNSSSQADNVKKKLPSPVKHTFIKSVCEGFLFSSWRYETNEPPQFS